jgi:hypothetical protein
MTIIIRMLMTLEIRWGNSDDRYGCEDLVNEGLDLGMLRLPGLPYRG